MGVEGGELRELAAYRDSYKWVRSWSLDGRSIYFHSNRSGNSQLWRAPVDGGEAVQVTKEGGADGRESPDGKWFYFLNSVELGGKPSPIWRMPVGGGPAERVLENVSPFRWELTAKGIYFVQMNFSPTGADELKLFSLDTGRVSSLGQFPERVSRSWTGFSASPDGRAFITVHDRSRISDLILLKTFQ
jgi:dipeptidyl aminopeptidase/acylaminoacyl peptidase